jgi:type III pantothenate kinase
MILCLDVGNSQIFGGVFKDDKLLNRFRYNSTKNISSDQIGMFLKNILAEHDIASDEIKKIAICSVVPSIDYSLRSACMKYFHIEPFILNADNAGLDIAYYNPAEVGADRLANAIAATTLYPHQNLIIVDFGTATTFCAISAKREYLGGVIMAGMRLSMEALENNTAKLSSVEITAPKNVLGRSTQENIQSGLYYGQLAAVKEISAKIIAENFNHQKALLIGTGGFVNLFERRQKLFDVVLSDLVLHGLKIASQRLSVVQ